jgi:hypothetical protein
VGPDACRAAASLAAAAQIVMQLSTRAADFHPVRVIVVLFLMPARPFDHGAKQRHRRRVPHPVQIRGTGGR